MSTVTYAKVAGCRVVPNPAADRFHRTTMGYGNKIPTDKQVRLEGETKWRKVYAICHSNVASHYIAVKGETLFVRDADWNPEKPDGT